MTGESTQVLESIWVLASCGALVALGMLTIYILRLLEGYFDQRLGDLELAKKELRRHSIAMNVLISDPDTPRYHLQFAIFWSKVVTSRRLGHAFAERVHQTPRVDLGGKGQELYARILEERTALECLRPDLLEVFDSAIDAGLAAIYHQWRCREIGQLLYDLKVKQMSIVHSPKILSISHEIETNVACA